MNNVIDRLSNIYLLIYVFLCILIYAVSIAQIIDFCQEISKIPVESKIMSKKNCSNYSSNIQKLKTLDETIQNIIREATEVREYAYCPYSTFKVGAAVLCTDGTVFTGCNIENSAFTVGICAERCAYSKAISQGKLKFKAVAVIAHQDQYFTTPCGACRQFMSEFDDVDIYIAKPGQDDILVLSLQQILPFQFQTTDKTFV